MKISRFGNNNSELLDALIANANKETAANNESFMTMASKIITQKKPTSLREVLSQLEGFGDDMGDDMGDDAAMSPEMGGVGDELPLDGGDLPTETPGENDEVKQKIVDALVALCGGPEEAKACLEQYSGAMPGAEGDALDTPMDDPMADPMGESDPMGEPMGAELGGEADMPAPMEMAAPASPMEMPY